MKQEDLTADIVEQAIARVGEAAQGAAPGVLHACLRELVELQLSLEAGQMPDLDDYPEGSAALDFVAQLRKSSLGTPAAQMVTERTDSETVRRIAWHRRAHDESEDASSDFDSLFSGKGWSARTTSTTEGQDVYFMVLFRLMTSETTSFPVPVDLRYRTTDPYAIELLFHTAEEEPPTWFIARETLAAGLRTYTGTGHVIVWPRPDCEATACIALQTEEATVIMEAPKEALRTFLRRTYDLVPPGTESQRANEALDLARLQSPQQQASSD